MRPPTCVGAGSSHASQTERDGGVDGRAMTKALTRTCVGQGLRHRWWAILGLNQ